MLFAGFIYWVKWVKKINLLHKIGNMEEKHSASRRDFLKKGSLALAGISILPSGVIGINSTPPSGKLNIAAIGVGGGGFKNCTHLKNENIVALCDVDHDYAEKAFRRWPDARVYSDFRVLFEKENRNIDAVVIATPDHIHAIAAISALQLNKHVFVQAPMAHSIYELSRMKHSASIYGTVTQVGNSHASSDNAKKACEILWTGVIGDVKKVDVWADEPIFRHSLFAPEKRSRVPKNFNWDLFLGPNEFMEYNDDYTPYSWRNWWSFGGGTIAAVGADLLDPVFKGLSLRSPSSVHASSSIFSHEAVPLSAKVTFEFPQRDNLPRLALPPMELNWYDGGVKPSRPDGMPEGMPMGQNGQGVLFYGSKATLLYAPGTENPIIFKDGEVLSPDIERKIRRVNDALTGGHENDWVRAIKEPVENRLLTGNGFDEAYHVNETILLAGLGIRLQNLNKKLIWDPTQMLFTNISGWEEVKIAKGQDFRIENGLPKFEVDYHQVNALEYASRIITPVYRDGWMQV